LRLALNYLKQETLAPLRGLVRMLLFGLVGSLALAVGIVLLLLAALRVMQTETGAFHGNLSWVPYVVVMALAMLVIAGAGWRVTRGPAARRHSVGQSGDEGPAMKKATMTNSEGA